MNIQIDSISFRYGSGDETTKVLVHFNGRNNDEGININGYIPLSIDEYTGNEKTNDLIEVVKQKVSEIMT